MQPTGVGRAPNRQNSPALLIEPEVSFPSGHLDFHDETTGVDRFRDWVREQR